MMPPNPVAFFRSRLQISLRPELSLYKRLLLSPGLEIVRRSLGIEGASCERAAGSRHGPRAGGAE
jgi:hypothetical protein